MHNNRMHRSTRSGGNQRHPRVPGDAKRYPAPDFSLMKFSILSLLAVTTTIGLGIALYAEHGRHARLEDALGARHKKELAEQEVGLAVKYNVEHLVRNNYYRVQKSIRPDYEIAGLALVVNIFDNADYLDRQTDLRSSYGEKPSIAMAAGLLKQLNCNSRDNYFELYQQKMEMVDMAAQYEHFRLGEPTSDRRKRLNEFLDRALEKTDQIELRYGEIITIRQ